jgi:hypothetical protein
MELNRTIILVDAEQVANGQKMVQATQYRVTESAALDIQRALVPFDATVERYPVFLAGGTSAEVSPHTEAVSAAPTETPTVETPPEVLIAAGPESEG